eukprot:s3824_g3.t1
MSTAVSTLGMRSGPIWDGFCIGKDEKGKNIGLVPKSAPRAADLAWPLPIWIDTKTDSSKKYDVLFHWWGVTASFHHLFILSNDGVDGFSQSSAASCHFSKKDIAPRFAFLKILWVPLKICVSGV